MNPDPFGHMAVLHLDSTQVSQKLWSRALPGVGTALEIPFPPSQVDPRELGAGDLAERLQETDGPGHSKCTETLPAQVGAPGPRHALPLLYF